MRHALTLAAVLALSLPAGMAQASSNSAGSRTSSTASNTARGPCRDSHGKVIKCPAMGTPFAGQHCRDMTTRKSVRCGTPGAVATPATAKPKG